MYTLYAAVTREIREEVNITPHRFNSKILAILNDMSDDVGRHHLGVVYNIYLTADQEVKGKEADTKLGEFKPVKDIDLYSLENWSRLILENFNDVVSI